MRAIVRPRLLAVALLLSMLVAVTGTAAFAAGAPAAGRLEKVSVHGRSLAGNLSGDAADRAVNVYLPPGYETRRSQRYPVLYFLHGFGVGADRYVDTLRWPQSLDRAFARTGVQPMIVVMPDALTPYGGSMYSNSIVTGDWEAFVARDLVDHVDAHYRTLPRRESRGLAGHSMGGYGTLRIAMKYPDRFVSLYAMSSCCLDPRGVSPSDAATEKLKSRDEVAAMTPFARTTLASSAAWAANASRPPFFIDLPTKDGQPQPDVLARYAANSPVAMASQYAPQLKSFRSIVMDIGTADTLIRGNEAMVESLKKLGVKVRYETYDGDHGNRIPERVETLVIPFFAKELASHR